MYLVMNMKTLSVILCVSYILVLHILIIFPFNLEKNIPKSNLFLVSDLYKKYEENFREKTIAFQSRKSKNASSSSIYIFGDSIIQGFNENILSDKALNFGIGNETILQLISRIDKYYNIKKVENIILLTGHNDLEENAPEIVIHRYKTLINKLPHRKLIVHAVLNVHEKNEKLRKLNDKINKFNLLLYKLCEEFNIKFININSSLNVNNQLNVEYQIGDGVHLNEQGNWIFGKELKKHVRKYN